MSLKVSNFLYVSLGFSWFLVGFLVQGCQVTWKTWKTWKSLENGKNKKLNLENLEKRPNFAVFQVFPGFDPKLDLAP